MVAVEANPELANLIRRRYPDVRLEPVALGAEPAQAELMLGRLDGHSTLSREWADRSVEAIGERWSGESVVVAVETLDSLIARHGQPDFVKIDVEGYEPQVLAGLHRPVRMLSLELQCAFPESLLRSLEKLEELGDYEYNLLADGGRGEWMKQDVFLDALASYCKARPLASRDVYARLRRS